jgi:hypothetical protein
MWIIGVSLLIAALRSTDRSTEACGVQYPVRAATTIFARDIRSPSSALPYGRTGDVCGAKSDLVPTVHDAALPDSGKKSQYRDKN